MNDRERILAAFERQKERDAKRARKRAKSYVRLSRMAQKKLLQKDHST